MYNYINNMNDALKRHLYFARETLHLCYSPDFKAIDEYIRFVDDIYSYPNISNLGISC